MKLPLLSKPCHLLLFSATLFFIQARSGTIVTAPSFEGKEVSASDTMSYQIISKGEAAGEYQAFPDACRLKNGDILSVFYAGSGHITYPDENYPKAGRICLVRSQDEGKTWSEPVVIYDDEYDNRDSHIAQLSDGTVVVTFFSLELDPETRGRKPQGIQMLRSTDNGQTWDETPQQIASGEENWYCSAPVREMPDGTLVFPVYHFERGSDIAWGGVFLSHDQGKSWGDVIPIGEEANVFLAAETDVIQLKDGSLFAALRGQEELPMHYAVSKDEGKTWSEIKSMGFLGHSPHLNRLSSGEILLSYRGINGGKGFSWDRAYTALRISYDDGQTWQGPYLMSKSGGAYPSTVELKDNTILMVFYEEGEGSGIGALRFEKPNSNHGTPAPETLELLPFTE